MRRFAVAAAGVVLGVSASWAARAASARIEVDSFEAKVYRSRGEELKYRELRPDPVEPGRKYPLVLFLHGAGGRGDDNRRQLEDGGFCPGLVNNKADLRGEHACFMIAPQVPGDRRWVEVHWGLEAHTMPPEPGSQMRMALELVDKAVAEYPIDRSRIYVTGLSMGGFGTWDAIQRRPGFFAAAVPVCGGGDAAEAPKLKRVPIWAWHGDSDNVVLTRRSRDMVAAIKAAGGDPRYTELKGVGHFAWGAAYSSAEMWEWMFAQRRRGGVAVPAGERVRVACVGDSITFGSGIRDRRRDSYPAQLGRLLGVGWDVRNYGVSGRTMLRKGDNPIWKERAYRDAKDFKPHVVVIKLGTNDTKPQNWRHKDEFAADARDMVEEFRALESRPVVFLCRPVPAFAERWGISDERIRTGVLPLVDGVAAETGAEVIDLYAALEGKGGLFPDQIHPNAEGAGVMASVVAEALKKSVER